MSTSSDCRWISAELNSARDSTDDEGNEMARVAVWMDMDEVTKGIHLIVLLIKSQQAFEWQACSSSFLPSASAIQCGAGTGKVALG